MFDLLSLLALPVGALIRVDNEVDELIATGVLAELREPAR